MEFFEILFMPPERDGVFNRRGFFIYLADVTFYVHS